MSCLFYKANGHIADISIDSLYTDIDMRTYKYPTNEHAVKDSFYYSTLSSWWWGWRLHWRQQGGLYAQFTAFQ